MKRVLPYLAFAVFYAGLLYLTAFALDKLVPDKAGDALMWLAPLIAAPLALLLALRLGVVTSVGVALTSLILVLCVTVATALILVAVAVPVVGPPSFAYVAHSFVHVVQLGGWGFWLIALVQVGVPWLWSLLLLGRGSDTAQAAA